MQNIMKILNYFLKQVLRRKDGSGVVSLHFEIMTYQPTDRRTHRVIGKFEVTLSITKPMQWSAKGFH